MHAGGPPAPSQHGSPPQSHVHYAHPQPTVPAAGAPSPSPPVTDYYVLSTEEAAHVARARQCAIAMTVAGVVCLLTSWTTWVGIVGGFISLFVGATLLQRTRDGNTVYNGKSPLCCCCSTPWSQLDACCSGAITAGAFAVVTIIVNVALVITTYGVAEVLGIIAVINALAAIAVLVTCVMGTRATRAVVRHVFLRIDHDVNQFTPAPVVMAQPVTGSVVGSHQHSQQQSQSHVAAHNNAYGSGYNTGSSQHHYGQQQQPQPMQHAPQPAPQQHAASPKSV
eukprot:CAMPEP_0174851400 /NCGR_PEP_ID=MMETSP1114-20130205/23167_1 /TAXON_ID=312471 /ORGANISM="Neobodo designis, Strain CCAP 1951/1" /LENGTH=279 /DNA_ID=CAMNT_0016085935 /DNA_START=104 /DNA_END=943 /DNA_ORIENTATION=+